MSFVFTSMSRLRLLTKVRRIEIIITIIIENPCFKKKNQKEFLFDRGGCQPTRLKTHYPGVRPKCLGGGSGFCTSAVLPLMWVGFDTLSFSGFDKSIRLNLFILHVRLDPKLTGLSNHNYANCKPSEGTSNNSNSLPLGVDITPQFKLF